MRMPPTRNQVIVILFGIILCLFSCTSNPEDAKELKLTEAERKNIKSIFELSIRIFCADVTLPSILGKPLELKDLFVKNSTAYPRWDGPYLAKEYYKYIDLFSVKITKESDSYGRPYWDYEVIEK